MKPEGSIRDLFGDEAESLLDIIKENAVVRARKNLPFLKQNTEKMQKSRGAAIEVSITAEHVYNHILSFMGVSWDNIFSLSFGDKTQEIIKILETYLEENEWRKELINMMNKIKDLRNMYAHIPQDYENEVLRFNTNEHYYKENIKKYIGIPLEDINKEFKSLSEIFTDEIYKILKILILKDIKEKWEIKR